MALVPRVLMSYEGTVDLREGMFFLSCFGTTVPADLLAAVTVHGAATNKATAGFASPSRFQDALPVSVEHWDSAPAPAGEWNRVLTTHVCLDTSGELEFFSGGRVGFEFPVARGWYVVEGSVASDGDGADRWRVRLWHAEESGPDSAEISRLSRFAR
ncbi:hypothetical protein [Tsukamurella soli]|uniref:Uncharacterized protein n=1 Tax=Tsukamurella soli TaxID=644556 RepID=A0ABP8KL08_9ACTN